MDFEVRKEEAKDYLEVYNLIVSAFADEAYSDHNEQNLVNRLRKSDSFIPDFSLVACANEKIIGHILLTKLNINDKEKTTCGLALAPVSVLPDFQNKGIGTQLIHNAHELAKSMDYPFIVVVGHASYYPRFGYQPLDFNLFKLPFEVPQEICFIKLLQDNPDLQLRGELIYDPVFFE